MSCWKLFLVCFLGWLWLWRVVVLEAEAVHSTIILLYVMYEEAVSKQGAASSCTFACRERVKFISSLCLSSFLVSVFSDHEPLDTVLRILLFLSPPATLDARDAVVVSMHARTPHVIRKVDAFCSPLPMRPSTLLYILYTRVRTHNSRVKPPPPPPPL